MKTTVGGTGKQPWIRVDGDYLIISRCNWVYPQATEDVAGPRDEQRSAAIERRDGDIVLSFRGASVDAQDVAAMLAYMPMADGASHQEESSDANL